ncbi:hypothetical protein Tco_0087639 [Tanacetum coccineum]
MSTLAEFMILFGGDNRPPMLEKHLYDSWKSIMELYMQNKDHERMILESVEHGLLIWPTIEENGVTGTKKYEELSATEKIQADCDLKATNIILQGLPYEFQLPVNHHRVAKLSAGKIQLQKQRSTAQLRIINEHQQHYKHLSIRHTTISSQFQQQFSPSPSPQYGSIHLIQHYSTTYPSKPRAITYPSTPNPNAYSSTVHQDAYSGLTVPVFKQGDDTIDVINKMMSFLSTVVTSRFPTTNNQLKNSSNPRQQATIHDERVTVQSVQGRQSSFAAGTSGASANISGTEGNNLGQQRVVKCFNCQGEAQGSGKVLNEEKLEFLADLGVAEAKAVLMANLSSYGSDVLSKVTHSENTHNEMLNQSVQEMPYSEQTHLVNYPENEITSDSNIIPYSQYLLETQNAAVQDTNSSAQQDAMILSVFEQLSNQLTNCNKVNKDNLIANESLSVELERYKERFADFEKEINYHKQTLSEQSKENELLTKIFNVLKNESKEKEAKNIDKELSLEKKVKELDNIICKMGQSTQTVHMLMKPQVLHDNNLKQALGFQNPFYLKKA